MPIYHNIMQYAPEVTGKDLLAVLYLVFLEGVLSVDNALALAALVRGRLRSEADRKKALHYGIWGAYIFRIIVIFAGVWLMQHAWVKWVAAGYLVYLAVKELFFKSEDYDEPVGDGKIVVSSLWRTIIAVELMDITFSVDSIAVALSVSNKAWVLIAGAVLGILAMRFAAQGFIALMEKFPILEKTAFVLVLLAGLKIIAGLLEYEVPEVLFMCIMFGVVGVSMIIQVVKNRSRPLDYKSKGHSHSI